MRSRSLVLFAPFTVVLVFCPVVAYAQTSASDPGALPAVSLPIAVTTVVSLLLGVVNMVAQGSILNLVTVPKTWAGPATIVATFLTGVGSFLATAAQPWTGSTAFYALAFGLFGIFGGGLPAFALHTHTTMPKMLRAAKMAAKSVPLVLGLGIGAAVVSQAACTPAQSAAWDQAVQTVLRDVNAGKSMAEIVADVGKSVGFSAPVEVIVLDALNLLIDAGQIAMGHLPDAVSFRDELAAKIGDAGAPAAPTHVLRAAPGP